MSARGSKWCRDGGKRARSATLGLKVTAAKKAQLQALAEAEGVSLSEVVNRALDHVLAVGTMENAPPRRRIDLTANERGTP